MNAEEYKTDFSKLLLPHEVLVAYHQYAVAKGGPRNLEFTCEEEEQTLSIAWIVEDGIKELREYGWPKEEIERMLQAIVAEL